MLSPRKTSLNPENAANDNRRKRAVEREDALIHPAWEGVACSGDGDLVVMLVMGSCK